MRTDTLKRTLKAITGDRPSDLRVNTGYVDHYYLGPFDFIQTPIGYVTMTPVTRDQWRTYAAAPEQWTKTWVNRAFEGELPANYVSLDMIDEFISDLNFRFPSQLDHLGAIRLPTYEEAYGLAVADGVRPARLQDLGTFAWQPWMQPVGMSKPNAYGLFDMLGCIWQWCSDGPPLEPVEQPGGAVYTYERRYVTGGSWQYKAEDIVPIGLGGTGQFFFAADSRVYGRDVGFRLIIPQAVELPEDPE